MNSKLRKSFHCFIALGALSMGMGYCNQNNTGPKSAMDDRDLLIEKGCDATPDWFASKNPHEVVDALNRQWYQYGKENNKCKKELLAFYEMKAKEFQSNYEVTYLLAQCQFDLEEFSTAVSTLESAIQINNSKADAYSYLALVENKLADVAAKANKPDEFRLHVDRAQDLYMKAVEMDTTNLTNWENLSGFYFFHGNWVACLKTCAAVFRRDPVNEPCLYNSARAFMERSKDEESTTKTMNKAYLEEAMSLFLRLIKVNPSHSDAYLDLVVVLKKLGFGNEAIFYEAKGKFLLKKVDESYSLIQQLHPLDTANKDLLDFYITLLMSWEAKRKEAEIAIKNALEKYPEDEMFHDAYVYYLYAADQMDKALSYVNEKLEKFKESQRLHLRRAFIKQEMAKHLDPLEDKKKIEVLLMESASDFETGLKGKLHDLKSQEILAQVYRKLGTEMNTDRYLANEYLHQGAIFMDTYMETEDPHLLDEIKMVFSEAGKKEDNITNKEVYYFYRGQLDMILGDPVSAESYFGKALKINPCQFETVLQIMYINVKKNNIEGMGKVKDHFVSCKDVEQLQREVLNTFFAN